MRAWAVSPDGGGRLVPVDREEPVPRPEEVVVAVSACGVCRTDLHLALHELPPRHPLVVPGHEAVGIHLRTVPLVPHRRGEPLPSLDVHGMGHRRRLR